MDASYQGPHLIFTSMGDGQNPAHLCYSQVGRISEGNGQIVNLGSPECLAIGKILHETLHALGKQANSIAQTKIAVTRCYS